MLTLEKQLIKRTIHFVKWNWKIKTNKKVWDVLNKLWINEIWTWKNDSSISHDNILYK